MTMYITLKPVCSKRTMETLKYAVAVWNSFSDRQHENIYAALGWDA